MKPEILNIIIIVHGMGQTGGEVKSPETWVWLDTVVQKERKVERLLSTTPKRRGINTLG